MNSLFQFIWECKRNKALRNIRRGFDFYGASIDSLTDDELEERILNLSQKICQVGITAEDSIEALRKIRL